MKKRIFIISISAAALRLAAGLVFYLLTESSGEFVYNVYTTRLYPLFTAPVKFLVSLVPFSLGEMLLYGVLLIIILLFLYLIFTIKKHRRWLKRLGGAVIIICLLTGGNFFWYGGINYNTLTFAELSGLEIREHSVEELKELCVFLGEKASESRKSLQKNSEGVVTDERSLNEILALSTEGYRAAASEFDFLEGYLVAPKGALSSEIMSYEQISGIFPIVFTESIVNTNTPVYELPHTACHELSHQLGFMREDEANFVGFLACINSSDGLYIYSGYLSAFESAMNRLASYDYNAYSEVWACELIDNGIAKDIRASSELWNSYKKKAEIISKVSEAVNDTYLKSNNIYDGTYSYGRVVDLLLAYYN